MVGVFAFLFPLKNFFDDSQRYQPVLLYVFECHVFLRFLQCFYYVFSLLNRCLKEAAKACFAFQLRNFSMDETFQTFVVWIFDDIDEQISMAIRELEFLIDFIYFLNQLVRLFLLLALFFLFLFLLSLLFLPIYLFLPLSFFSFARLLLCLLLLLFFSHDSDIERFGGFYMER